jgi:hypothetical protein
MEEPEGIIQASMVKMEQGVVLADSADPEEARSLVELEVVRDSTAVVPEIREILECREQRAWAVMEPIMDVTKSSRVVLAAAAAAVITAAAAADQVPVVAVEMEPAAVVVADRRISAVLYRAIL